LANNDLKDTLLKAAERKFVLLIPCLRPDSHRDFGRQACPSPQKKGDSLSEMFLSFKASFSKKA
jgi:hypothetical protein